MKKIIVVGATSAMAEHCMRQWVKEEPVEFFMAGRNKARLDQVVADLKVRQAHTKAHVSIFDFQDLLALEHFVDEAFASGPVQLALIAHGYLGEQRHCQENLATCKTVLEVNGLSPVLFAEAIAKKMEEMGEGKLAVIGSVAGDRGRKSNYVYGAAKGLVERYIEGMQHRFAGQKIQVILLKPGPTATPMTAHLVSKGMALAPVEKVALQMLHAIEQGRTVAYIPKKWAIIMGVIKRLPVKIFHRLNV